LYKERKLRQLQTNIENINPNSERKILVLPYINPISEFISSNTDSSKTIIGFRCLNKLSQFVAHKDKDHLLSKNNVIYKIFCKNSARTATYVGQTKRQLGTRFKEHKNNLKQDQSKYSVISEHIIKYNHSFDCGTLLTLWIANLIFIKEPFQR